MPMSLSPAVLTVEVDLSGTLPGTSTSVGAIAGLFRWGKIGIPTLVTNENSDADSLTALFATPSNYNAETWFTAANFLAYANSLLVIRAANTSGATPVSSFVVNATANAAIFTGNTTGLTTGMYVTQTGNASVLGVTGPNVSISAVNSTGIVLSQNALANGTLNLYFGHPETSYTAVAMETGAFCANLVNQVTGNSDAQSFKAGNYDTDVLYIARYPGAMGNSLRISVCDTANTFSSNIALAANINFTIGVNTATIVFTGVANVSATTIQNDLVVNDLVVAGNATIGVQYLQVTNTAIVSNATSTILTIHTQDPYRLHTNYTSSTLNVVWEFYNDIGVSPGQSQWVLLNGNTAANDQMHVVVVDDNGLFTGTPGTILETWRNLSRATDALHVDGTPAYYATVINQNSQYIWWTNDRGTAISANSALVTSATSTAPGNYSLSLGADGYPESNVALSVIAGAYNTFASKEDWTVDLIMQGSPIGSGGSWQLANYVIDNIAEVRKDCVFFYSPDKTNVINNAGGESLSLISWRNNIHNSSYAVGDTGYKYQYDPYNNLYRNIPLNGDIAGLCARTDATNDPWWSPAGYNRGQIKNIVRLAWNPSHKADRDLLYVNEINPVVSVKGRGIVLLGDKTSYGHSSDFEFINVRRLFNYLKRIISRAAEDELFEFNDSVTRAQFVNLITPTLRDVQGRRGIIDFQVVCDSTNNTGAVIDAGEFKAGIYIKPARSIQVVILSFVAVATSVEFSEVIRPQF